jgi:hypothetical protein
MTSTSHPANWPANRSTPPEPTRRRRTRVERAILRAERRAARRAARRALSRARRTHQPSPPGLTSPPTSLSDIAPAAARPSTGQHETYPLGIGTSAWLADHILGEAEAERGLVIDCHGELAGPIHDRIPTSVADHPVLTAPRDWPQPRHRQEPGDGQDYKSLESWESLEREIEREHREGLYLTGFRLVMLTLVLAFSVIAVAYLLATPHPTGPTTTVAAARPVVASTPLTEPAEPTRPAGPTTPPTRAEQAATEAVRLAAPAQALIPATRAPEPLHAPPSASAASTQRVRAEAGALAITGSRHDRPDRCDSRDGRASVVRAGPITVSIPGIDLARLGGLDLAAERCDDLATTRRSSTHNTDTNKDSGNDSGKDNNHSGKDKGGHQRDRDCGACGDPNRGWWAWPSDPHDWPGWHGDGLGPNSGYGHDYGPGYRPGYDRYDRQDPSHQRTHRFDRHSRGDANDPGTHHRDSHRDSQGGKRSDTGAVCRVAPPGLVRGLPDGGAVCRRAATPHTSHHTSPTTRPDTKPDTRPKVTPHTSPNTGPGTSPKPKPDTTPKTSPDTRPGPKPNGPAQTSPKATPDTRPQPLPQPTPKITPNDLDHGGAGTNKYGF